MVSTPLGLLEARIRGKRIVVVDDEPDLATLVETILKNAGFEHVSSFSSSREVLVKLSASPTAIADLLVLDIMMPELDGYELLTRVRALSQYRNIPAIYLTAKDEPSDRVSGLMVGADDYISKPFLPQELVLRIAALLRRSYAEEDNVLELEDATVDFSTALVERSDGTTVQLTAKELQILSVLARNAGRIVTIDGLCEACWGTSFGYENSLMAHIRRIREKIERDASAPVSLVTIKGLGYKLNLKRRKS